MRTLLFISLLIISFHSLAHKSSDSYLTLVSNQSAAYLSWDIAIQDLNTVLDLDVNGNGEITWGELKLLTNDIQIYVFSHLDISVDGELCQPVFDTVAISKHSDGAYIVLKANLFCDISADDVMINYQLFFDVDRQHRGLLSFSAQETTFTHVFSPDIPELNIKNANSFLSFVGEGIWHIWIGFDHILFLVSLLLPAVLIWRKKEWHGAENTLNAGTEVVKVVTAFTLAHSITLSLVFLGVIGMPIMMAESLIAASVVVAALLNVLPQLSIKRWMLGFGFGLIHGFGFASVLSELNVTSEALFLSLVGFNVGVELGQLAIVAVLFPIAYFLRSGWFYKTIILNVGSYMIAALGLYWLVERTV